MKKYFPVVMHVIRDTVMWISVIAAIIWIAIFFAPKLFGYYPFVVMSGSMEPVVHTGSLAYVELFGENDEPVPDAIHAYKTNDGTMVLHRLMGMSDTGYVFKGDANDAYDAVTVNDDAIVGLYAWSIPYMGYVGAWVSNHGIDIGPVEIPAIVLFIAGVVLMLNVICEIIDRIYKPEDDPEDVGAPDMTCNFRVSHKNQF